MAANNENVDDSNIAQNLRLEVGFHKSIIAFERRPFEDRIGSESLRKVIAEPMVPHFAWEGGSVLDIVHELKASTKTCKALRSEVSGLREDIRNLSGRLETESLERKENDRTHRAALSEIQTTINQVGRLKRCIGEYIARAEGGDTHGLLNDAEVTRGSNGGAQRLVVDDLDIEDLCEIIEGLDPSASLEEVLHNNH